MTDLLKHSASQHAAGGKREEWTWCVDTEGTQIFSIDTWTSLKQILPLKSETLEGCVDKTEVHVKLITFIPCFTKQIKLIYKIVINTEHHLQIS